MQDLKGRSVLITGAASGIGRAAACEFARQGASTLILNDIDPEGLAESARLVEELGARAVSSIADVSDSDAVQEMAGSALELAGGIDVLVNVAGIGILCPLEELRIDDWHRVMEVDFWGTVNTTLALLPHMMERRSGHVVNVASVSGLSANMVYIAPYVAAKHGVVGFSRALQAELSLQGIGISCICPGAVRTPIYETGPIRGFKPEMRSLSRLLLRFGEEPEDTARAIVRAVRRNRFLVITTPLYRFDWFMRRHFTRLTSWTDHLLTRAVTTASRRYRSPGCTG
ncbi:MAG: SDR family oxidoreductase [Actinobacteria bacterium]|nr:SDR family oxidoreductase [Actinomycetota bacterium]MBU1945010.1 SDR family oxidoreductase [Actinomycetota bacterium]MBU2686654.1 SDR family oxidoreductase [Actinomycetota bacterium]